MQGNGNDRNVAEYLSRALGCQVAAQRPDDDGETRFEPADDAFGRLHIGGDLLGGDESELLERLRGDGVDELLRKGEKVKVTRRATEILPRG